MSQPTPLHLKYRPQTLAELVGQPVIQTCLTNTIVSGKIAPAYLFVGSRGTGKTSSARIFAKSLNCLNQTRPTVTPCGTCESCRSIETSSSLDVNEIDAASHGGVDDARDLVRTVGYAPINGRYRIIIIDECHNLTKPAQDALLKCIEEPPSHIIFILCTTEAHKVLTTITSRCQVYTFQTIGVKTIKPHLATIAEAEKINLDDDGLTAIARLCAGGLRDALQLLSKAALLGVTGGTLSASQIYELAGTVNETQLLDILQAISAQDVLQLLQAARALIDEGKSPKAIHTSLLEVYRDLLILNHAPQQTELLTSPLSTRTLSALVQNWQSETIQHGLAMLHEAEGQLRLSYNEQTWLEVCLLNMVPQFRVQTPALAPLAKPTTPTTKPTPPSLTTAQVWQKVLDNASLKNQALLSQHTKLDTLAADVAVLIVDPAKEATIVKHKAKIAEMIGNAANLRTTPTLQIRVLAKVR